MHEMTHSPVLKSASFFVLLFITHLFSSAQDSTISFEGKTITLTEVIVRSNINVPAFIERVKADTTFYKAFRNLRVLGFTSLNDIRMMNKKGMVKASLESRTKQHASGGCRITEVLEEKTSGDFYNRRHEYNYYTAELYAGLFFAWDTVCGETNIVKGTELSTKGKSGMARHKEQLKMLFFNPGKKIPGIPLMGNKVAVFDEENAALYDFVIDMEEKQGKTCYVFKVKAKEGLSGGKKDKVVIDEMTTWFDYKSFEVLARNYSMSYDAGVYDFDVQMEVQMTKYGDYLVPSLLRYTGNWDVIFKKKERGVFTATLFDFEVD